MPSTTTRRLLRLPVQALAALVATIAAIAAFWYGGQAVLTWLGVANPARGDTGTALGLGATALGSSVVPGYQTVRYYFESKDRLTRSAERTPAREPDAATDVPVETPDGDADASDRTESVDDPVVADPSGDSAIVNAPHQ